MADSWTRPFDASYDFVRVSRETGLEVDFVRDIENGGSIERNANTALYETASLSLMPYETGSPSPPSAKCSILYPCVTLRLEPFLR